MATAERPTASRGSEPAQPPPERPMSEVDGEMAAEARLTAVRTQHARKVGRVVAAYTMSMAVWGVFALLLGLEYHLNMRSANPSVSFWDSVRLPIFRFFCFALLTPP